MARIEPTNPFHIARAYQVQVPAAARRVTAPGPVAATEPVGKVLPDSARSTAHRIVAGVVPGRVVFGGSATEKAGEAGPALPMYRHPADKNAAATGIHAGRLIDVQG